MPLMRIVSHPDCPRQVEMRIVGIKDIWQSLASATEMIETERVSGTDLRMIEFTDQKGRRCSVCLNPYMASRLLALREAMEEDAASGSVRLGQLLRAMYICPEPMEGDK